MPQSEEVKLNNGLAGLKLRAAERFMGSTAILDLANLIEEAYKLGQNTRANESQWVSVKKRLPEAHENVLVCFQFGDHILTAILDDTQQWAIYWADGRNSQDKENPITHWQPLPQPPKA